MYLALADQYDCWRRFNSYFLRSTNLLLTEKHYTYIGLVLKVKHNPFDIILVYLSAASFDRGQTAPHYLHECFGPADMEWLSLRMIYATCSFVRSVSLSIEITMRS